MPSTVIHCSHQRPAELCLYCRDQAARKSPERNYDPSYSDLHDALEDMFGEKRNILRPNMSRERAVYWYAKHRDTGATYTAIHHVQYRSSYRPGERSFDQDLADDPELEKLYDALGEYFHIEDMYL
jgi:hypothetical protein